MVAGGGPLYKTGFQVRDTASRGITEQEDRITETKINVGVPRAKAVGLSGRVPQPWVLPKEAKRCTWILKRPGDCGAQRGAREARRATELSLSRRCKWARLQCTPQSHLPERKSPVPGQTGVQVHAGRN